MLARLAPGALKENHHRLAMRLEHSANHDIEVLAVHFHAAGESERAGVYYAGAAERASASLAFDRAATLYRLALELRAPGSTNEYLLRARLGDALANARRGREAGQVYLEASPGVSRPESIDLRRRAFQQLLTAGEHDRGLEVLREVFRDVGLPYAESPSRAVAMTAASLIRLRLRGVGFKSRPIEAIGQEEVARLDIAWSAGMGLSMIDTPRAAQILCDNFLRALRAGSALHAAQAMFAVSVFIAIRFPSRLGFSRRLLRSAEDLMGSVKDPTLVALDFMTKAFLAYCQGEWSDALASFDRAGLIFREECTGVATSLDISAYFSLLALFWLGDFQELARRRRALLQEAQQRNDLFSMTNYRAEVMAYDLQADGDPEGRCPRGRRRDPPMVRTVVSTSSTSSRLIANVRIDLYRGNGIEAAQPA